MLNNLHKYNIILGSQSPRRKELLSSINIDFEVKTVDTDETYPTTLMGCEIPVYLAKQKAQAFTPLDTNDLLITADTIVWFNNQVFGKPSDINDARNMLLTLSGKTHHVFTGVCITSLKQQKTFHAASDVRFSNFTLDEIDYYLEHFKPYDKAGSYGVQEWIGYIGVESILGSYFNVMGLPIQQLYAELKQWK